MEQSERINIDKLLSLLKGVKPKGKEEWQALCPAHNDTKPSLSVKLVNGKILLFCHSGCTTPDIVASIGLTMADLNPNGRPTEPKITATYDYTDADGKLLYQVVRYDPKAFKQRRPDGNGGWHWNIKGITPVLYRLPEVLKAMSGGQAVYICEGENDTDNLHKIGLTATTNSGGAEKWRPGHSEALMGASVVILPDKDVAGQRHATKVAASLHSKARSIKIVELPDRDGHQVKDVSDWLATGGIRADLERLASEATEYKPKENGISLVCIADVEPETVSWLWLPYIPVGKLTLLEGDPGIGKSWVSLAIATAVSLGKGLPGKEAIESASVVLASAEDGLGDTIRPRLDAMGADDRNIHAIKGALDFGDGGLAILEGYIEQVNPSLVIIDPLVAYIGAGVDIHRANETRAVMAKLADVAEKHGCAILTVRHLTKGGALKAIYRGLGSIDITAACRSVLMAGCDPDNPQKRGIVQIKSNLAPMGKAIGYELQDGGFYWTGESDLTAARILAVEDSSEGKSARDEAADFLRDELADGAVEWQQIEKDRKAAGIAEITLRRARESLGVKIRREGEPGRRGGGRSVWELPEVLGAQKDLPVQLAHIEKKEQVNQASFKNGLLPKTGEQVNTPDGTALSTRGITETELYTPSVGVVSCANASSDPQVAPVVNKISVPPVARGSVLCVARIVDVPVLSPVLTLHLKSVSVIAFEVKNCQYDISVVVDIPSVLEVADNKTVLSKIAMFASRFILSGLPESFVRWSPARLALMSSPSISPAEKRAFQVPVPTVPTVMIESSPRYKPSATLSKVA